MISCFLHESFSDKIDSGIFRKLDVQRVLVMPNISNHFHLFRRLIDNRRRLDRRLRGIFPRQKDQGVIVHNGDNPLIYMQYGGESGIRTHETAHHSLLDFESSAFGQLGHLSSNFFIP